MQGKKLTEITVDSLVSQIERVGQSDLQKTQKFFYDSYHLLMDHELFNEKTFRREFTNAIVCLNSLNPTPNQIAQSAICPEERGVSAEDLPEIEQCLLFLESSMMLLITHEVFDSMMFRIEYCNAIATIQTLMIIPTEPFAHP